MARRPTTLRGAVCGLEHAVAVEHAMGAFAFDVAHVRPMVAVVAVHGTTDIDTRSWPFAYALCCLVPLPAPVVTGLFVAGSLVHFAEDVGPSGSLALHSLAGMATLLGGTQRGLEFMLAYLACVHTPAHYVRCWRRRRWRALGCAAVVTLAALGASRQFQGVVVGHAVQRLVFAHVVCEYCVANRITATSAVAS